VSRRIYFEIALFIAANFIFPIVIAQMIETRTLGITVWYVVVYGSIGVIALLNLYLFMTSPGLRVLAASVFVLNLAAVVFLGEISFVSVVPKLPYMLGSAFQMVTQ